MDLSDMCCARGQRHNFNWLRSKQFVFYADKYHKILTISHKNHVLVRGQEILEKMKNDNETMVQLNADPLQSY